MSFIRGALAPMRMRSVIAIAIVATLALLGAAAGLALVNAPDNAPDNAPGQRQIAPADVTGGDLASGAGDGHAAVRLQDGRILVTGGTWHGMGLVASAAELWDPTTGDSIGGPIETITDRVAASATLLQDGRVLLIGGYGGFAYASTAVAEAELWDPATSAFEEAGRVLQARVFHTATLLPTGRVLLVGGAGPDGDLASAELYDPQRGVSAPAGRMAVPRFGHTATVLADGRILIVGGFSPAERTNLPRLNPVAEIWDPATRSFSEAGEMIEPRGGHTATRLSDGRVLVVGGEANARPLASAEIWDPDTGEFGPTGELRQARGGHTATLLGEGRVAVIGGQLRSEEAGGADLVSLASTEIWDPDGTFSVGPDLAEPRTNHSAIPADGSTILVIGGGHGPDALTSVEVWRP